MLAIIIILTSFILAITAYNLIFKKYLFSNELNNIRIEKIQEPRENMLPFFPPTNDELINYLNKIINDSNTEIVKKYFYSLSVFINMQQFLLCIMLLFSLSSFSQEQPELDNNSFFGYWGTNDSSYYLSIKNTEDNLKFTTYKFVPYEDDSMNLSWERILSPGTEEFIKRENNIVLTDYWIEEQNYYVKITYTLINSENLKAEFNGKLNGEPYYNIINYNRVNFNK